jgi:hypothetical protein
MEFFSHLNLVLNLCLHKELLKQEQRKLMLLFILSPLSVFISKSGARFPRFSLAFCFLLGSTYITDGKSKSKLLTTT